MKKIINFVLRKCSIVTAPLALALAIMTMNSTCWLFSCQPDVPDSMSKYVRR